MIFKLENKRLALCAEMLAESDVNSAPRIAADIGADHGYLACALVESGVCEHAIAADINPKPLSSAIEHIAQSGLADKIDAVLSDGLENVPQEGVTDVICAGMGGELIAAILSRGEWQKQLRGCTLILQPMTKADELRRWLFANGWHIMRERACRDGKFVYSVMAAHYAPELIDYPCDGRYLTAGRLDPREPYSAEYISTAAQRMKKAALGRLSAKNGDTAQAEDMLRLAEQLMKEIGE